MSSLTQFSKETIKAIGYYVYILVDPKNNIPFYIGKGCGNRVFSHVKSIQKGKTNSSHSKDLYIQKIQNRTKHKNEVLHYIVRYGLTHEHALLIESVLIDLFNQKMNIKLSNSTSLTNINDGFYSDRGCITAEALEKLMSSKKAAFEKGIKYLAINLNSLDNSEYDNDDSIYQKVHFAWILNPNKANQADYILATHAGLIVGVYKLNKEGWQPVEDQDPECKKKRYYFNRDENCNLHEIRKKLLGHHISDRPKGAQNPVWYIAGWTNKKKIHKNIK